MLPFGYRVALQRSKLTVPMTATGPSPTTKDRFHYELPLLRYAKIQDIAVAFFRFAPSRSAPIPRSVPALPGTLPCGIFSRSPSVAVSARPRSGR